MFVLAAFEVRSREQTPRYYHACSRIVAPVWTAHNSCVSILTPRCRLDPDEMSRQSESLRDMKEQVEQFNAGVISKREHLTQLRDRLVREEVALDRASSRAADFITPALTEVVAKVVADVSGDLAAPSPSPFPRATLQARYPANVALVVELERRRGRVREERERLWVELTELEEDPRGQSRCAGVGGGLGR